VHAAQAGESVVNRAARGQERRAAGTRAAAGRAAEGADEVGEIAEPPSEETMFDHVGLPVSDFARSLSFYRAALEPLGYGLESHDAQAGSAGFGRPGAPQLWLGAGRTAGALHLAFQAKDRASVQRFHSAALAAGGKDNGKPGPRPSYGETYYAAFVLDPDGYNVEAVCLRAE